MPTDDRRRADSLGEQNSNDPSHDEVRAKPTIGDRATRKDVRALADKLRDEEARRLSAEYGLNYARLRQILRFTAEPPLLILDSVGELEFIREHGLIQRPSLAFILEELPFDEAVELIDDPGELWTIHTNMSWIENASHFPFYTLHELRDLTASFVA